MNYGDFSSVVQLGVGLHAGTAILQIYGELGFQPLLFTIERIKELLPSKLKGNDQPGTDEEKIDFNKTIDEIESEIDDIESRFVLFKTQFHNEYIKYFRINTGFAILLAIILVYLAIVAQKEVVDSFVPLVILFVGLSLIPAPLTLVALWSAAKDRLFPIQEQADALEERVFKFRAANTEDW